MLFELLYELFLVLNEGVLALECFSVRLLLLRGFSFLFLSHLRQLLPHVLQFQLVFPLLLFELVFSLFEEFGCLFLELVDLIKGLFEFLVLFAGGQ